MSIVFNAPIQVELSKSVLKIILNNPESSNSINYELITALVAELLRAERDEEVRVVILTGAGKNFCSGGDLKNMMSRSEMFSGESDELRRRYEQGIQQISRTIEALSKPLIAAVNGAAAGAGCDLACMCDIRIGTSETKFLENFVKVGLVPGDGGSFFLQRVVGYARAMEMTLTGRVVGADEALQIGLLNKIVQKEDLLSEAVKMADLIAQNPPVAVQLSKKALKFAYESNLHLTLELLSSYQGIAQRTEDHQLALESIQNKKLAVFRGR